MEFQHDNIGKNAGEETSNKEVLDVMDQTTKQNNQKPVKSDGIQYSWTEQDEYDAMVYAEHCDLYDIAHRPSIDDQLKTVRQIINKSEGEKEIADSRELAENKMSTAPTETELTAMEQDVSIQEQSEVTNNELVAQETPEKNEEIAKIENEIRKLEEKIEKLEKDSENYYGSFYTASMDLDRAHSWSGATMETFFAWEKIMTEYENLWKNTKKELDKTKTELEQKKQTLQNLSSVLPEIK